MPTTLALQAAARAPAHRRTIGEEADRLGRFLGAPATVSFSGKI